MSDLRFRSLEEYRRLHEDRIKELETQVKDLESRLIFLEELGIEAHINQHNRDEHERDVS